MKKLLFSISTILLVNMTSAQTPSFQWAKQLGGSLADKASALKVDASGNVYTVGLFNGSADFNPGIGTFSLTSNGATDIFISKLDATGNFLWAKSIGGVDFDEATSTTVDAAGNVYITGYFKNIVDFDPSVASHTLVSSGLKDIFVLKLDPTGSFVFAKNMGGLYDDEATAIGIDNSGNIYTTGYFMSNADFDPSPSATFTLTGYAYSDMFISKLDATGNFVWAKYMGDVYGGSSGYADSKSIYIDGLGNVFTTGSFNRTVDFNPGTGSSLLTTTTYTASDAFISKLDATGNFVWAKQIGGGVDLKVGTSVIVDNTGNVYTTGLYRGTADFDPNPSSTFTISSNGIDDTFVLKLNSLGDYIWAKSIGGSSYDEANSIIVDAISNVYIGGSFSGVVDFDPSTSGVQNLTGASYNRTFILKLNTLGNYVWAINNGGNACYLDSDGSGNIYTSGYFSGTADFDPTTVVYNLTATGSGFPPADVYVQKLGQALVGINEVNNDSDNLSIYPNPTNSNFTIKSSNNEKQLLQIVDITGNVVLSQNLIGDSVIDASSLANGVYTVLVSNNQFSSTNKLVIIK